RQEDTAPMRNDRPSSGKEAHSCTAPRARGASASRPTSAAGRRSARGDGLQPKQLSLCAVAQTPVRTAVAVGVELLLQQPPAAHRLPPIHGAVVVAVELHR